MYIHSPASKQTTQSHHRHSGKRLEEVRFVPDVTPDSSRFNTGKNRNGDHPAKTKKSLIWSPWKLMLIALVFGVLGIAYLTHVFETQERLREVQQLRQEYERVHRLHTDARREYDRMIGPAEVYRRAEARGMIYGGATDPVILR